MEENAGFEAERRGNSARNAKLSMWDKEVAEHLTVGEVFNRLYGLLTEEEIEEFAFELLKLAGKLYEDDSQEDYLGDEEL